jgi:16S rRNA (cytosine1402-N4)-methyltransferase
MYCGAVEFVCSPASVKHIPVLLDECMACLRPERGGVFADLTFGGGGHSREILEASSENSLHLGISSFQLMEPDKGFSFRLDAPIDMRLDPRVGQSAAEFLESASYESLVRAVREYGEERRWRRVVDAIIKARGTGLLSRTMSAAELVSDAVGGQNFRQRIHPATKTFQGIQTLICNRNGSTRIALY